MRCSSPASLRHAPMIALVSMALAACQGRPASVADAGPPGPSLAFLALPTTASCDADADTDTDGFQLEVAVELDDDDGSGYAQLVVSNSRNNATAVASLVDGPASLIIEVVPGAAPGADNTLTASSTNAAGRTLETSAVVVVDCEVPPPTVTCAFTAPLDNAVIDVDNADVAVTCVSSALTAAQRAWMATARLRIDATATGGTTRSSELDLQAGSAAGNVLFPGNGAHTLTLTLLDPDGVYDPDPTQTIDVDVQLP